MGATKLPSGSTLTQGDRWLSKPDATVKLQYPSALASPIALVSRPDAAPLTFACSLTDGRPSGSTMLARVVRTAVALPETQAPGPGKSLPVESARASATSGQLRTAALWAGPNVFEAKIWVAAGSRPPNQSRFNSE